MIEDPGDDPENLLQKADKGKRIEHRYAEDFTHFLDALLVIVDKVENLAIRRGQKLQAENTVKTRMFHARKRLSELLAAAGVDRGWP